MAGLYNKYIFDLPIIPKVVSDIINISNDSNISSSEIENILKIDPYLTSRLLKVANSSFYSRQREIKSVKDAITLIGLKKTKTICLLLAGSEIIGNKSTSFYMDYWEESIDTAFIAKSIADNSGKSVISEDIFTAGILHNIGQAILFNFSNDKYNNVLKKNQIVKRHLKDLELEEFGITNHQVAAGVLQFWEFPQLHIDVVKNYLDPSSHSKFQSILDIVSISKIIHKKIKQKTDMDNINTLLLTFKSRLNLKKSDIDFFISDYQEATNSQFYNICQETIFN